MKIHEFKCDLWLPQSRAQIFSFFSDPANLDAITPPWLHFKILTPSPMTIKEGTLLHYRLRVHGIPLHWTSKITSWNPLERFVDEQLRGPYRLWVHEHTFQEHNGGTLVKDFVRYATPLDLFLHRLFVRPDLVKIFKFRSDQLQRRFDPAQDAPSI